MSCELRNRQGECAFFFVESLDPLHILNIEHYPPKVFLVRPPKSDLPTQFRKGLSRFSFKPPFFQGQAARLLLNFKGWYQENEFFGEDQKEGHI